MRWNKSIKTHIKEWFEDRQKAKQKRALEKHLVTPMVELKFLWFPVRMRLPGPARTYPNWPKETRWLEWAVIRYYWEHDAWTGGVERRYFCWGVEKDLNATMQWVYERESKLEYEEPLE